MDWFDAGHHLAMLHSCERTWRGYTLPMATPAGSRYPFVYPRDLAAIARAYERMPQEGHEEAFSMALRGAAEFLLATQGLEGGWGQRYDFDTTDRSIYLQEDNPAHAVATLARHVRHERRRGQVSPIESQCLDAMERGLAAAKAHVYRKGINLFYSTTSIHESPMERGYTIWTNGAYRDAYRLASDAAEVAGRDDLAVIWDRSLARLDENIQRHFVQDGQWIRRITPEGRFDRRPDVTLLSPFYFHFEHLDEQASERSCMRIEHELWDPDLGLLQRYLPFREDRAIHLHAGNGPWLAYSAWLAQRHASRGNHKRARELLRLIAELGTPDGHLPEHVSTPERFHDFMDHEWETGLDFRKEFDPEILLARVGFTEILGEAVLMREAYADCAMGLKTMGDNIIRFATPLAWSHAEFAVALAALKEKVDVEKGASGS